MQPSPAAIEVRGHTIESRHPFSAACVVGDHVSMWGPDWVSTWRSAAKPFQLAVSVAELAGPFSEQELAIGAASHSAQSEHIDLVDALLNRFDLEESDLFCGAHAPVHVDSAYEIARGGGAFDNRHNNCSGKHAFMAAAARACDWSPDYRSPNHPYQTQLFEAISRWCGLRPTLSVDGCGVPTFCLPISAMARAWAVMATHMADEPTDILGSIGWAMSRHPQTTSGTDRFDAVLMQCAKRPMAVKIGARGVFCIALPEHRAGITVKVHSGCKDALCVAVPAALKRWFDESLELPNPWPPTQLKNVVGDVVGRWSLQSQPAS
ncbi:MAG TPA: hypothetical protein DCQ06_11625 [Myxococcales bacterium]|nr:hypothetical protein [Myxococcales bacterium]